MILMIVYPCMLSHSTGFKAISTNLGANATVYAGLPMDPSIYYANPEEAENFEIGLKRHFQMVI